MTLKPVKDLKSTLVLIIGVITTIRCQTTTKIYLTPEDTFQKEEESMTGVSKGLFVDFEKINEDVDSFTRNGREYLISTVKDEYWHVAHACRRKYGAELAILRDKNVSEFIAVALSETRLDLLDTLWIGAKKKENTTDDWVWMLSKKYEEVSREIRDLMVVSNKVEANDRNCLGFGREDHDIPQFRPLVCTGERSYICEREDTERGDGNSTHPGWIKLGKRLYKIFNEYVDYDTAWKKCAQFEESQLAVVDNLDHSQKLGRYLLIGRPSLENAWIGASWVDRDYEYTFEAEQILLENSSHAGYPPWRHGRIQKIKGCILLDRHLANITLFVEARCERSRPYICYKLQPNETATDFSDIFIDDLGYRLFFKMKEWYVANQVCSVSYVNYSAKLPEIEKEQHVHNLLYVMGENRTDVQHLWLGGKLDVLVRHPVWKWQSNGEPIPQHSYNLVNWINNLTYTKEVEQYYVCLNMDRENHLVAIHYGTVCTYAQHFACQFPADKLRQLEEDEKNNVIEMYD